MLLYNLLHSYQFLNTQLPLQAHYILIKVPQAAVEVL